MDIEFYISIPLGSLVSHPEEEDYYLIVSALVPYKRIDLAIESFNRSGRPLKIVGLGPDYKKLRKTARNNIQFLGSLSQDELLGVYQGARALLMPGEEDFGITSLEAQACGIPVIAYGCGGATESVVEGETGLFFTELKVECLLSVLDKFEGFEFNKKTIRENAMKFSRGEFKRKMTAYLQKKWNSFKCKE